MTSQDPQDTKLRNTEREGEQETVLIAGNEVKRSDIIRLAILIAFFVAVAIIVALVWPMIQALIDGGPEGLVTEVRSAGGMGVLMLLGIQFLQIIVAFIPGELVQLAAGMMYGPWLGALIILVGCVVSSTVIYLLVHNLGQPFVESMVSTKYLERFREFEESGRLTPVVFLLFLIPGLPKDVFTYLVPLTDMPMKTYLLVTTIARIPGVLMSTYAASGLIDGNIRQSIAMFVVLAIIAGVALLFKDRLLALFRSKDADKGQGSDDADDGTAGPSAMGE